MIAAAIAPMRRGVSGNSSPVQTISSTNPK
jgi:hypothetical protein